MMSIPDPREGTQSTDHDCQIRYNSPNEDGIVLYIQGSEHVHNLEKEPEYPRESTSAVNTPQVLIVVIQRKEHETQI
jgi:hypothetical protein